MTSVGLVTAVVAAPFMDGRHASNAGWPNLGGDPGNLINYHQMPDPAIMTPAGLRKFGLR